MVVEFESSTPLSTVEEMMLPKTEEVWKKRKKTPKKRTITWSVLVASSLSLMSAYLKRMKHQHTCAIRAWLCDFGCCLPNLKSKI